jgi:hypothetical protein
VFETWSFYVAQVGIRLLLSCLSLSARITGLHHHTLLQVLLKTSWHAKRLRWPTHPKHGIFSPHPSLLSGLTFPAHTWPLHLCLVPMFGCLETRLLEYRLLVNFGSLLLSSVYFWDWTWPQDCKAFGQLVYWKYQSLFMVIGKHLILKRMFI